MRALQLDGDIPVVVVEEQPLEERDLADLVELRRIIEKRLAAQNPSSLAVQLPPSSMYVEWPPPITAGQLGSGQSSGIGDYTVTIEPDPTMNWSTIQGWWDANCNHVGPSHLALTSAEHAAIKQAEAIERAEHDAAKAKLAASIHAAQEKAMIELDKHVEWSAEDWIGKKSPY